MYAIFCDFFWKKKNNYVDTFLAFLKGEEKTKMKDYSVEK